jgi:hypothetical protein
MLELKDLGKYKIEKTEDYDWARSSGEDLSYYEMIRVKGSKPKKILSVPSHLYKYGENSLCLYLMDHKSLWRKISAVLNEEIDVNEEEALFKFPIDNFNEIAKMLPFVRKKIRKTPMSEKEKEKARFSIQKITTKRRHIIKNFNDNLNKNSLDDYLYIGDSK